MVKKKKPRNKPRNKKLKVKTKFIDLMKKFLILSISAIIVNACSSNVKGSWSCPVLEGGKGNCASISEADNAKLADNDFATPPESYFDKQQKIEIKLVTPKLKTSIPSNTKSHLLFSLPSTMSNDLLLNLFLDPPSGIIIVSYPSPSEPNPNNIRAADSLYSSIVAVPASPKSGLVL